MKVKTRLWLGIALALAYGVFLLWYAPARLIALMPLPTGMVVTGAAGTLWQGSLQRLSWRALTLDNVRWKLTVSGLMPALAIAFNHPDGIEGHGTLRGWRSVQFYQWRLAMPANQLFRRLRFIVPVRAEGQMYLNLQEATVDRAGCQSLDANMSWSGARVNTPLGELALATPRTSLRCQQGAFEASLRQTSSQMQLSGKGRVTLKGEYQFAGQLRYGDAFPTAMKQLMAVGKADELGVRMLNVQGRLR
ncbi:type II secretion system protein N [Samsonia erythrinae]|uniref:Type II secretion system protein N n=1 Tax=Samsonia erythrinae TaxID=160434 RepID=A0A4R3VPQ2_9GAMM|nr:type II secretion system protein N [Samsonia erythrinae]TCV07060.1 type II secretion system protein N (GspN) [Samsonia erythrinae]